MAQVSVIVPTFNRRATLARALDSVRRQTLVDWELLVIDDGSTDGTAEWVAEWRARHALTHRCELVSTANLGVSHARNLGASLARAPWLAFLDSDDEWLEEKLAMQIAAAPGFALIHSEEIWWRDGRRVLPRAKHAKGGGFIFCRCVEICCISPSTVMMDRAAFLVAGGFREDFPVCEDYELWLRISAQNEIGFVARPLTIKHGGHADQLSFKYSAMDYWRVKALAPFLDSPSIAAADRAYVAETMARLAAILAKGFLKYPNPNRALEVQAWALAARQGL